VFVAALIAAISAIPGVAANAATTAETLWVDGSDAPQQVWHARLRVPLAHGGDVLLAYPKWIPGAHGPVGPVSNLGSLRATAAGANVPWTRDPNDTYAFHFAVPAGARELDLSYDFFEGGPPPGNITAQLGVLDWNEVTFFPRDANFHNVTVQANITLPKGWSASTALPPPHAVGATLRGDIRFSPVTLETLVDSPLYAGAHVRTYPLVNANGMTNEVDVFGENAADVEATPLQVVHWRNLVAEADALYGSRHWQHYHFLLTLSDTATGRGLEHHSSSADGLPERYLHDPDIYDQGSDLLPHEFTHSWNGKYRRPIGLVIKNYSQPMKDDLLWVYEGMTQYWGIVLASRSGLARPGTFEETLASYYAQLDAEPGRQTRPLLDTARAQGLTRAAQSPSGRFQRRGEDYYIESALMWLDADTLIRERTHGARSLDDFARRFLGVGGNTPPRVVPYDRRDVIADLNAVYRYDWATFFRERVDAVAPHPPLTGITRGGWRFVFTPERTEAQKLRERTSRSLDATYSLGATFAADGTVPFTIETMPLARAGVPPGAKILAVNNEAFTPDRLRLAIDDAVHSHAPIAFIYDDLGTIGRAQVHYYGGERYPRLVRVKATPDLISAIIAPKTKGIR
jgi:predicted metalloprotease with PDZ domain